MRRTQWQPCTTRKKCLEPDRISDQAGSSLDDQVSAVTDIKYLGGLHDVFACHVDACLFKIFADSPFTLDDDGEHHLQKFVCFFMSLENNRALFCHN